MHKVELKKSPEKFIRQLSRKIQFQLIDALEGLSKDPRPAGVKKLAGMDNLYRIRCGDYRVVYTIQDKKLLILVVRIAHRKEVYKNLR
jgi:mRNA interferase RelE/StbE